MIRFVILGAPVSHKNGYHIVTLGNRPAIVKSREALAYERDALAQIPPAARVRLEGPVRVTLRCYYPSERPDLDESLILDVLQDRYARVKQTQPNVVVAPRHLVQAGVYRNDRQVREKHVYHAVDKANPRTEIVVEPLEAQQAGLDLAERDLADELLG